MGFGSVYQNVHGTNLVSNGIYNTVSTPHYNYVYTQAYLFCVHVNHCWWQFVQIQVSFSKRKDISVTALYKQDMSMLSGVQTKRRPLVSHSI